MRIALLALSLCVFATPALAEDGSDTPIQIERAYAYQTTPAQRNGAVFLTLTNITEHSIDLTSASSDVADRVEIHSMDMQNGIMEMRALENLRIDADKTVTLEPAGHHIMLIGLKAPLDDQSNFDLTLNFDDRLSETVSVKVVPPGSTPVIRGPDYETPAEEAPEAAPAESETEHEHAQ